VPTVPAKQDSLEGKLKDWRTEQPPIKDQPKPFTHSTMKISKGGGPRLAVCCTIPTFSVENAARALVEALSDKLFWVAGYRSII